MRVFDIFFINNDFKIQNSINNDMVKNPWGDFKGVENQMIGYVK